MTAARDPLDEEDICTTFACHPASEGYTEAEFRAVLADLLSRGIVRRVPYHAADGTTRYRIERAVSLAAFGAFGCA